MNPVEFTIVIYMPNGTETIFVIQAHRSENTKRRLLEPEFYVQGSRGAPLGDHHEMGHKVHKRVPKTMIFC